MTKARNYLTASICMLLVLFSYSQCVKEDTASLSSTTDAGLADGKRPVSSQGVLPVNLSRYDLNSPARTKSSAVADTSFFMCLDSLADYSKVRQVYYEDSKWLYCQFPLKSNETGIYGAIAAGKTNFRDSLVQIKCFYLQVGNSELGQLSEYVVTMIPTRRYSTVNPDFDFLNKPSFSGVILYSDKDGNLLRTEHLSKGVIRRCLLQEQSAFQSSGIRTKSSIRICLCGAQTLEEDGVCISCKCHELDPVIVIGDNLDWENYIWMMLRGLSETEFDYVVDGGGGNWEIHDGRGGGGIEDSDTKVLVTCRASGCYEDLLTITPVTKSSSFSYTAPLKSGSSSCWFQEWDVGGSESAYKNGRTVVLQSVTTPQTLTAIYANNNSCSKIAELMNDPKMMKVLDTLYSTIKEMEEKVGDWGDLLTIEYASVWYNGSKGLQVLPGTKNSVNTPLTKKNGITIPKQMRHHSHYHPGGRLRPSTGDYISLCMFFLHNCSDTKISTYSIMTKSDVMLIRMQDPEKFQNFMSKYLIDKKTPDWYTNQRDKLTEEFSIIFESKKIYAGCRDTYQSVGAVKNIISEMGLELYWSSIEDTDAGLSLRWNNTDYLQHTPISLGCLTKLRNK